MLALNTCYYYNPLKPAGMYCAQIFRDDQGSWLNQAMRVLVRNIRATAEVADAELRAKVRARRVGMPTIN